MSLRDTGLTACVSFLISQYTAHVMIIVVESTLGGISMLVTVAYAVNKSFRAVRVQCASNVMAEHVVGHTCAQVTPAEHMECLRWATKVVKSLVDAKQLTPFDKLSVLVANSYVYQWFEKGGASEQYGEQFVETSSDLQYIPCEMELMLVNKSPIEYLLTKSAVDKGEEAVSVVDLLS